jgi:hypothetical protein
MATPTKADVSFGKLALKMIAKAGRTMILRQPTTVELQTGPTAGASVSSPLSSSALTLDGDHSLGETVVDLTATGVTGLLVPGDTLTMGGVAHTVTGSAGASWAVVANAIAAVTITPALPADLPDGTAVTVAFTGTFTTFKGFVTEAKKGLRDPTMSSGSGLAKMGDFEIYVSRIALEQLGVMIEEADEIHFGDTTAAQLALVLKVDPIPSGEQDAAYRVAAELR